MAEKVTTNQISYSIINKVTKSMGINPSLGVFFWESSPGPMIILTVTLELGIILQNISRRVFGCVLIRISLNRLNVFSKSIFT